MTAKAGTCNTTGLDPRVAAYVPAFEPEDWEQVGPFVRACVDQARFVDSDTVRTSLTAVAHLALWCWKNAGFDLSVEEVFAERTVQRYLDFRTDLTEPTRGSTRSRLRDVARRLEVPIDTSHATPLPKAAAPTPYTRADITALRASVLGQSTSYRQRNLAILLALGGGVGIQASELMALRLDDIERGAEGTTVRITDKYTRLVPMIREWEDLLGEYLPHSGDEPWVFLPTAKDRSKNSISSFLQKTSRSGPRPNLQRLRSTWIVSHLNARGPIPALMYGAGVEWLTSIGRYVTYADPLTVDEVLAALRLDRM